MQSVTPFLNLTYCYLSEVLFQQCSNNPQERGINNFSSKRSVAISVVALIIGIYVLNIIKELTNSYQPTLDTSDNFWKELDTNQRNHRLSGPVVVMGKVVAKNPYALQKEMFMTCDTMSRIFVEYVQKKRLIPNIVIDLGCGIGTNSIPLLKQGVKVIAIDNRQYLLNIYDTKLNKKEKQLAFLQCSDLLALENYGLDNSADIVLAIDVLPYLPSSYWKSTMQKIMASLKPGGYLFGTVFVKKKCFIPIDIQFHEQLGAYYYSIQNLATRLIKHSGLEMIECRVIEEKIYEFAAQKPVLI